MGLSIPSGGVAFSASDLQLSELAPKIPKMSMFKNEMYFSAEQLFDMAVVNVNGGGTVTFDAVHQQMQLQATVAVGDWADVAIHLPVRSWPNSLLGFDDFYGWSIAGQFSISVMYSYTRGAGPAPSGSQRPFMNIAVEQAPTPGAINMAGRGFGWNVSNDFSDSSETQLHDGTALTVESTHPLGQSGMRTMVFEHKVEISSGDRIMNMFQSQGSQSLNGGAVQLGTEQIDKHYSNSSYDAQLHFNLGNWTKASSWNLSIGGVWLAFTPS